MPSLVAPLYSLCTHVKQRGSASLVSWTSASSFTSPPLSCWWTHPRIGTLHLWDIWYHSVQSTMSSLGAATLPFQSGIALVAQTPVFINNNSSMAVSHDSARSLVWPFSPLPVDQESSLSALTQHLGSILAQLCFLANTVACPMQGCASASHPVKMATHHESIDTPPSPILLSTMTQEEIFSLLHHKDSTLPPVCHCDTAHASNTKTQWSAKDIQLAAGNFKISSLSCK